MTSQNKNRYNGWLPVPRILPEFEAKAFGLIDGEILISVKIKDGNPDAVKVSGGGLYAEK